MREVGDRCEYQISTGPQTTIRAVATIKKMWKSDNKTLCSFEENPHVVNLDICRFLEVEPLRDVPKNLEEQIVTENPIDDSEKKTEEINS